MNRTQIDKCAQLLFQARQRGFRLYDIPEPIRPQDIEQAYACQKRLVELLGGRKIGFKAANTNTTSQQFLRLPEPFYGPLLESATVGSVGTKNKPAVVSVGKLALRLCEPEFALLVGKGNQIEAVAPAIEIVHSSFLDWKVVGAPSLIADLACNGAWIRGEPVPISQIEFDKCSLKVNGKEFAVGSFDRVMGSPMKVFEKLCSQTSLFDIKPGDWITTGVCVDPPYHYCAPGDTIEVDFTGGIGSIVLKCKK